jgi:hypothetical protein
VSNGQIKDDLRDERKEHQNTKHLLLNPWYPGMDKTHSLTSSEHI